MKKRNRSRKIGKVRSKKQRFLRHEDLEDRRMLAGELELIIGSGNVPSSERPLVDPEIVLLELEDENAPREQRVTNNTRETAQLLPLGFDIGEYEAIDVRGELIEPSSVPLGTSRENGVPGAQPPIPPIDDGSIPSATPVNHGAGNPIRFEVQLGDAVGFPNDADFYELEDLEVGQRITAHMSGAGNSVLALYNIFGEVLTVTETDPTVDNYISYVVEEAGDYYVAAVPYNGDLGSFRLPIDPNNSATVQPGGGGAYDITIGVDAVDVDYYAIDLMPGDILGVNGVGSTDVLTLEGPDGSVLMQTSNDLAFLYPLESPLPGGGTASLAYVIDTAGRYYLNVQGFRWNPYKLETRVFRPAIESQPEGSEQIVFLDFDGAQLHNSIFGLAPADLREMSPLSSSLRRLEVTDESDLIDRIIRIVEEDFDHLRGINSDLGIKFLNSRDHADPFGLPNVSRVIIGGSGAEAGITGLFGLAESIDVGNFDTSETAIVPVESVAGPSSDPNSIHHWDVAPGANKLDLTALGIAFTVSHELAHILGVYHSDLYSDTVSIIDSGGRDLWVDLGLGPDRVFGTHDDEERNFEVDVWESREGNKGVNNAPGNLANVLVRGLGSSSERSLDISGVVFDDTNGNGVRDAGESGIPGQRVYVDINRDGEFGIGEPWIFSTASGHYAIPNVSQNDGYEVRVAVPPGYEQTLPADNAGYIVSVDTEDPSVFDFGIRLGDGDDGGIDFDDAPESYGVASHPVVAGFALGEEVDGEAAPLENDGNDDDGISLSAIGVGETATGTVSVSTGSLSPGVLNGWIDFNRDGTFSSSEQVVRDLLVEDSAEFAFSVPADAVEGTSWARFRYGFTRGIGPVGPGNVGEVEDYAVQIGDGGNNLGPNAIDDQFAIAQDSGAQNLDVLANDDEGSGTIEITSASIGSQGGLVSVATDRQSVTYTPPSGFSGVETFTYSVASAFGTDIAVVTVNVEPEGGGGDGDLIRFRLETASAAGPIDSITPGGEFSLNVYAQDLRADGMGVFAAYLDVLYDSNLASVAGNVTFGDSYPAGQVPSTGTVDGNPGEFDEFGAFAGQSNDLGNAELLLYSVPMQAGGSNGQLTFSSNPADILPLHEVLLGDIAQPIPSNRIEYTSTTLTIQSATANAFTNPDNRFDVDNNGFVTPRDALVLINDINSLGARSLESSAAAVSSGYFLDVSNDGNLSAIDVLQVINEINRAVADPPAASVAAAAVDAVFELDDDDEDDELELTL